MFLQFIINGLITGIMYSLFAVGFAVVYNTTRIFHIAAAALYVFAAYMFYALVVLVKCPVSISIIIALLLTALLSWGMEWAVYRPLKFRKASLNVTMIASIGLMTIIVNVLALCFGNETKVITNAIQPTFSIGSIIVTTPQMIQLVVGGFLLIAFCLLIRFSRLGLKFRAVSVDDSLFETLGYSLRSTRNIAFLLSGVFIALASCLTVYDVGMDPHIGMNVLINAMVAMIIGGIGRFDACILGGLALGLLQALVVYQFSSAWQNAITFLIFLIFLFFRPQGIAGYKQRTV